MGYQPTWLKWLLNLSLGTKTRMGTLTNRKHWFWFSSPHLFPFAGDLSVERIKHTGTSWTSSSFVGNRHYETWKSQQQNIEKDHKRLLVLWWHIPKKERIDERRGVHLLPQFLPRTKRPMATGITRLGCFFSFSRFGVPVACVSRDRKRTSLWYCMMSGLLRVRFRGCCME